MPFDVGPWEIVILLVLVLPTLLILWGGAYLVFRAVRDAIRGDGRR